MFSQSASFLSTVAQRKVPDFPWILLVLMTAGGILGGMLGHRLNKRLSARQVEKLFDGLLVVIIGICVYNALRFGGVL